MTYRTISLGYDLKRHTWIFKSSIPSLFFYFQKFKVFFLFYLLAPRYNGCIFYSTFSYPRLIAGFAASAAAALVTIKSVPLSNRFRIEMRWSVRVCECECECVFVSKTSLLIVRIIGYVFPTKLSLPITFSFFLKKLFLLVHGFSCSPSFLSLRRHCAPLPILCRLTSLYHSLHSFIKRPPLSPHFCPTKPPLFFFF